MSLSEQISNLESLVKDLKLEDNRIQESLDKIRFNASDLEEQIGILVSAGVMISQDQEQSNVLHIIINTARALTNADGGTVYILEEEYEDDPFNPGEIKARYLTFEVMQNETMNVFLSGDKINLPPVPLETDGKPNHKNVSASCANTGKIVNIPDVYDAEGFDFSGAKKYDQATGYRSKSMLVIPLKDHENQINGVLQLINRKTPDGKEVIAFSDRDQALVQSVSFQAASTLTTARLLKDQVILFNSFVQVLAEGLGEKSPYNFSHINRVAKLSLEIAEEIDKWSEGDYGKIHFDKNKMDEISLAGWMHDIGKLTTPENIVSKSIKLELLSDRFDLIVERFNSKIKDLQIDHLQKEVEGLKNQSSPEYFHEINKEKEESISLLIQDLKTINKTNFGGEFLNDDLKALIEKYYQVKHTQHILTKEGKVAESNRTVDVDLADHPGSASLISEVEREMLLIGKGTLSEDERKQINDHADRSWRWLMKLPFPKKMIKLPLYAGAHHETLNGQGYPNKLKANQLPIQSRIIAIADIFEALTANDRPYKSPMPLSKALNILGFMIKDGHLDPEIIKIFLKSGRFLKYAQESLDKEQIDEVDIEQWFEKFFPKDFQHNLPYYQTLTQEEDSASVKP
ncbi:MAG: GAF domain-containing protein [Deltaproteobacteria bacterium]|nr:GAF domain-containing protein [Deltaproteobacteria bacterium]